MNYHFQQQTKQPSTAKREREDTSEKGPDPKQQKVDWVDILVFLKVLRVGFVLRYSISQKYEVVQRYHRFGGRRRDYKS